MNKVAKKRSCDVCRRKKIRCDGPDMPNKFCSNCRAYNMDCTYEESAKKRGPPKGYVESLEARLTKAEALLKALVPDGDFSRELGVDVDPETWTVHRHDSLEPSTMVTTSPSISHKETKGVHSQVISEAFRAVAVMDSDTPVDDEHFMLPEPLPVEQLTDNLANLRVGDYCTGRFFGKSSGPMLVQTALNMKTAYTGEKVNTSEWEPPTHNFRPQFWSINSWESQPAPPELDPPRYDLPEPDLLVSLIELYFRRSNLFFPILHRPTFERQIREGRHFVDSNFAGTVLLVAAVGSRHSDDERIFLGSDRGHSAGWKWFNQVSVIRRTMLDRTSLHDIHFYALCVLFLMTSSSPQGCWAMSGIGIRMAQDVGAHRKRKKETNASSCEDEQWKRAFWVLVGLDRILSSGLGRPCAIQEEDFDLDYPYECDDEWWDHPDPELAWKQPPGQPCQITAFNSFLRLSQILAQCHRTIYSINKHKVAISLFSEDWEQIVVTELDSILNRWVDSIPAHLLWDPNREADQFFEQSAWLHTSYYNLQILVHRPFISSTKATKHMMWSSFAICTNAARMSARIFECLLKRGKEPGPVVKMHAFTSAIVLLLAIFGGKKAGLTTNPHTEMKSVRMCMDYLKAQETRWNTAGRLWDILNELATVGDIPLPEPAEHPSKKRGRNDSLISPHTDGFPADVPSPTTPTEQRRYAGSKRVATHSHASGSANTTPSPGSNQGLEGYDATQSFPMYTTDLGTLPDDPSTNFFAKARDFLFYPPNFDTPVFMDSAGSHQPPPPMPIPAATNQPSAALETSFFPSGVAMTMPMQQPQQQISSNFFDPSLPNPVIPTQEFSPQSFAQPAGGVQFNNPMDIWASVPTNLDKLDDWAPYLNNLAQAPQPQHHQQSNSLFTDPGIPDQ